MQKLVALDWQEILEKVADFVTSQLIKEEALKLQPFHSSAEATRRFKDITDAQDILAKGLRPQLTSLDLFTIWNVKIKKNAVLKPLELKDVRHYCIEALALKEACRDSNFQWPMKISQLLFDAEEPLSAIDQILTPSGDIRMDASEKLYRLHKEKEKLERDVHSTLDKLVHTHQMEHYLQDKYVTTREGRWVLPVKSGMQQFVPGLVHGHSQTKQTVFTEPDSVVPMNNRIRQILVEIEDEIERLLIELSAYLHTQSENFENSFFILKEADLFFGLAQFNLLIDGKSIEFCEDKIELIEVKHPLLKLNGVDVVSNTVLLNPEKSILLLSGPNAGGKTVLLKSVGLAAQMARCGMPIPAMENSRIPFFKELHIGIGDAQSVDDNLSTFAAHLKTLNQAAKLKGPQFLLLLDEICGSTDPEEGSALAKAFIEQFSNNGVFAVITSHLSPLKVGWENTKVLNGSMEYDNKTGRPTYQFISGIPGESLAIQTAKRVGVDLAIVNRALDLVSPIARARMEGLEQIDKMKQDILQMQSLLKKETQKARELKDKYDRQIQQFEKEKDDKLAKTLKSAEKKVEEAIAHAKVEQTFKKHSALQEIKYQLPQIVKAQPIQQSNAIQTNEDFAKHFPAGSKVYVPLLQADGIIQSSPNAKGEVLILSGSVRMQVRWQDLKPAGKNENATAQILRQKGRVHISLNDHERTLDLRGKTVEDAISELEVALDTASRGGEDRIKIIHGHGTEALKKSVRAYLSRSIYVKKWKAAAPDAGGDGTTYAEIGES